jgi:hypothetical protein
MTSRSGLKAVMTMGFTGWVRVTSSLTSSPLRVTSTWRISPAVPPANCAAATDTNIRGRISWFLNFIAGLYFYLLRLKVALHSPRFLLRKPT